ncbi:GNAT family N-acetyltransferase [Streptococcus merionis]|uniref:GNAT family N-acetyltransferase n=1 Tax=Streptococcus merionis TaxID=400065 RepID=UPI0026ECF04A|nr:N-acetyltransferase [Streptococcus merionis]
MPIRPATPRDIPAIQELLTQILNVHHQVRPDLFHAEGGKFTDDELARLMENPATPIFVYVDDSDTVLGHLFLEIKRYGSKARKPVTSLFIEDLCVAKGTRGQGIGHQFYDFAKSYAKEHNCYNLTLNVWNANQDALRFYENLGFKPQQTQLEEIL